MAGDLAMIRKLFWLGLSVAALTVAGLLLARILLYQAPKSAAEISGTYVHDSDIAYQELKLRDKRTFTQNVRIKATSDVASSEGKWRYQTRVKRGVAFGDVVFDHGFLTVLSYSGKLNPDYAHPKPVIVQLPVEYHYGRLILWEGEAGPQWEKVK
jgi:hypothetical protein